MAHLRNNTASPFHIPRPTTAANMDDNDTNRTQVDPSTKIWQGKPDFGKWRTKLCRRYDDMECIFGNDTATGDRAVSGFDTFSPMQVDESVNELDTPTEDTDPSPISSRKRHTAEGTILGQLIIEKLEAMDLHLVDIMKVMKAFRSDGDLAKVFMSLTNTTIMRALVYEQLGRDPPPLP
ncbi:Uncharacterized protein Adt_33170 [Abeliophyllum distichum]|uniref:Uncharacterized protein n=1 Tax=Abeliophyllum distichum TaxID=126358 RepID=A0ABD1QZ31_9LAMI